MKNTHLIIISVFLSLISGKGVKAQTWTSLDGKAEGRDVTTEILKSDASVYKAKMSVHGFYNRTISIDGNEYQEIYMDEGAGTLRVGEPNLPTITQSVAIPDGATYKVSITEEKWQDIEIGKIYPAQETTKGNEPTPPFTILESAYKEKEYSPFLIGEGNEGNWRNIRFTAFAVCPFKYYPLQNKLSVLTEFVLQVDFTGGRRVSSIRQEDLDVAKEWNMFSNDVSNFPVRDGMQKSTSSSDYDYLIIVGNIPAILNSQALQEFTKWKAFKGYKTKVVSTTTIGATTSSIKNYISTQYNNNGIKYVLFIGDQDKIPLKSVSGFENGDVVKSDYWYGCLTGGEADYYAEIPIGRFSTDSLAEFENMVEKTISYERSYDGDYQKALLVAHKEYAPGKYQGCSEEIRNAHSSELSFFTAYGASSSVNGNNATNEDVVNYINSGMHIVNYRGHGDTNTWGYQGNSWNTSQQLFGDSKIDNLTERSIFFNVCCQNGNIQEEPCFMETFTRSSKGAIACLGATENIWTVQAHILDKSLFSQLCNSDTYHIGNLNTSAQINTINNYLDTEKDRKRASFNALSFICGGDPTLEIWTGNPQRFQNVNLTKEMPERIIVTSPSLSNNCTVSIVSEAGDLLYKRNSDSSTFAYLPQHEGNYYIVLNRHNYYPFVIYINQSDYIQDEAIDVDIYHGSAPMNIGYDVTTEKDYGNVTVKTRSKLKVENSSGGVTIKNGFECERGAELIIE